MAAAHWRHAVRRRAGRHLWALALLLAVSPGAWLRSWRVDNLLALCGLPLAALRRKGTVGSAVARRAEAAYPGAVIREGPDESLRWRKRNDFGVKAKDQKPVRLPMVVTWRNGRNIYNPLRDEVDMLPKWPEVQGLHITIGGEQTAEQLYKDLQRFQDDMSKVIENPVRRLRWSKIAQPLERLLDRVDRVWSAISLLRSVNTANCSAVDVDRGYHTLLPKFLRISTILGQSEDIYEAMRMLSKQSALTEAQQRILYRFMQEMWHSGVGLQSKGSAKLHDDISDELAYLANVFNDNLASDESRGVHLLTSAEDVSDWPREVREECARAAQSEGYESATADQGPWLLTLAPEVYQAALELSVDRGVRESVLTAYMQRGWRNNQAEVNMEPVQGDNSWIVGRMLDLRHQWARMFRYSSWADMVFTMRMASQPQVEQLLGGLRKTGLAAAESELQELQAFAAENGAEDELKPWDVAFWRRRLMADRLSFREEDLQPYFPFPAVLQGVFDLLFRLFNIKTFKAKPQVSWRDDVLYFVIVDGEALASVPIGGLYIDMASPRSAGEPDFTMEVGLRYSELLGATKALSRRPVVHILGHFGSVQATANPLAVPGAVEEALERPRLPASEKLLTFQQVRELFHTMGEAVQELLTTQTEGLAAGRRGLELDVVDVIPQFLELWAYDPATLQRLGRHHQTGEPLPRQLAESAAALRSFHTGLPLLEEVQLAQLDLNMHSRFDPEKGEGVWQQVKPQGAEEIPPHIPLSAEESLLNGLGSEFATGYAVGRYAALWAKVLASDIFEAFQEIGLDDDANARAVRDLGLRFRSIMIEPGGGRKPVNSFSEFRGRAPRASALLRLLGLVPAQQGSRDQKGSDPR